MAPLYHEIPKQIKGPDNPTRVAICVRKDAKVAGYGRERGARRGENGREGARGGERGPEGVRGVAWTVPCHVTYIIGFEVVSSIFLVSCASNIIPGFFYTASTTIAEDKFLRKSGNTGARGVCGDRAVRGVLGVRGVRGDRGSRGSPGSRGLRGSRGSRGFAGFTGFARFAGFARFPRFAGFACVMEEPIISGG